ncbi:hypothetical protein [Nocardioides jiangxiensis]|uniref:YtxH domain-containing protein n=1 Tax=Nocardioides jiangxiensis TaxID=3064524 RepID=A0ABT9B3J5_9ACTN|nr:hypothetical protein [Nocardioides sp. WY-20]MDO7868813.1 hypothetical protein [Nocardioides sp. WY-20]
MRLHRMSMLAAGGVGYVLGAKAGRGRYEQIRHVMKEAPHATEVAREKVMATADKARHLMHKDDETGRDPFAVDPMEPESYDAPRLADAEAAAMPQRGPAAPTFTETWKDDDPATRL